MRRPTAAIALLLVAVLPAPASAGWTHSDTGITSIITGAGLMLGAVDWNGCGDGFKAEHHVLYGGTTCLYTNDAGQTEVYNPRVMLRPNNVGDRMLSVGTGMVVFGILMIAIPDNSVTNDMDAGFSGGSATITKSFGW